MKVMDVDEEISSAVAAILAARYQPKVGDRVRVRLNGECRLTTAWSAMVGHVMEPDGGAGTVISWPAGIPFVEGHPIAVRLDDAVIWHGREYRGGPFAPTELELIAPAPAPLTTEDAS